MVRATSETVGTDHLWAKAAELERDFAGYKRRLAERKPSSHHHAAAVAEVAAGRRAARVAGDEGEEEEEERVWDDAAAAAGRGRRYEEYVRRRDERLRHEWRARMQRKEAEVQALWARLDRTGSRGGGDDNDDRDGELELVAAATTSHGAREDQVKPPQKPGNLVVKLKPSTPATPRGGNPGPPPPPATAKLARPRTGVPSSLAAGSSPSARLSTPDPRRRPSHLHREQPPATPRKESRLPLPPPSAAATPRPRTTTTTMLSRSRSMFKDRGCSSAVVAVAVGENPRPPRFQPPRSSYDSSASRQQPAPAPSPLAADAIAAVKSQSISCPRQPAVVADRKKASAVAPEPFLVRRPGNGGGGGGPASSSPPPVVPKHLVPYSGEIAPAGCENADKKSNQQEHADQSSDNKLGSEEMVTGDSDTEPSYVFIKKDSDEQIPRPPQPAADNQEYYSDDVEEDNMESTGSNEVAGETTLAAAAGDADEEEFRRESSDSLYSNVQSSFSQRSELDTSPESNTSAWARKSTEVEADAERRVPTPTTPRSSVQSSSSPMDAVNGLKRLLTFGKRNGKASNEAAAAEHAPHSVIPAPPPAGDDGSVIVITSRECPAGGSAELTVDSSDDLDSSYVMSPHAQVRSLQSFGPSYPASSELKEPVLHAKSPRVHRSFFSFSSFKSRAN